MEAHFGEVAKLAQDGHFGPGKFLRVIPKTDDAVIAPQFASQLGFLAVELEENSKIVRKQIVVKIQPKTKEERMLQSSDDQFFVEVAMYRDVLPLLGASGMDVIPLFVHGVASRGVDPDSDVVIMGDLSADGYVCSPDIFLAPETIKMTLRRLGEFHGYSYRAKNGSLSRVQELGRTLPMKRVQIDENEDMPCQIWDRGFNAAKKRRDAAELFDRVRRRMSSVRSDQLWNSMRMPKEPFAVIIHGDFNRNNLMFKYNNEKAEKVKFLDFQTSLYSDPAVDIAFFLYMNSDQETRNDHWDDFFKTYWEGVISIEPFPGFGFEEFLKNFASRALYGYLPCSFFLPIMLETEKVELTEYLSWSYEDQLRRMMTAGGDVGEKAVADIIVDLHDRGFLEEFLVNFDL